MSRRNKLRLLGGASALAFALAVGGGADAAPVVPIHLAPAGHSEASRAVLAGDPLVEPHHLPCLAAAAATFS